MATVADVEGPFRGDEPSEGDEPRPADVFGWWAEVHGDGYCFDDIDDELDELESTAPLPLPPDDRLWRHPSELHLLDAPEQPRGGTGLRLLVGVAVAAGCLGAFVGAGVMLAAGSLDSEPVAQTVVERRLAEPVTRFASTSSGAINVVAIAERTRPSIVRVEIEDQAGLLVGSGSGVVLRNDGHIVTNAHVVEGAASVEVVTHDGRTLAAAVVGSDSLTDIAVLKVEATDLEPVVLGSTANTQVGEPAVAIGSPLRLEGGPTVTVGVVSALGRSLAGPDSDRLYDLVQTDAPISPGSSGGALLDGNGSLIGITTIIAVSGVGAEGLGFATPVEIAHEVAIDLIETGRALHGFLGIAGDDLPSATAVELGLQGGAVVNSIGPDTPAVAAGIEPGDIIVEVDGVPIPNMAALVVAVRRGEPGQSIELRVVRDGESTTTSVVLTERPASLDQ